MKKTQLRNLIKKLLKEELLQEQATLAECTAVQQLNTGMSFMGCCEETNN